MPLNFNERQLQVIAHVHGPMLVVAGAGTGKTSVLVERIARLIRDGHARPDEILALTFADNAADEMSARVRKALAGVNCEGLRAMTFHANCMGLLQATGKGFRLLTPEDLWVYLRQRISELGLSWYIRASSPGQFLDALLEFFARCHDELVSPRDYRKFVDGLNKSKSPLPRVASSKQAEEMPREEVLARCEEIAGAFETVEKMLERENLGTFPHMITRAVTLLREDHNLRAAEQKRARFLLLDEFQDVNVAQIELAQLLAGTEQNVFAVGDPDQAIYRFRGASAAAFGEFARRFPKTKRVTLVENQRSHNPVLKCAYAVIRGNPSIKPAGFEREPLESARDQRSGLQGDLLPKFPVEIVTSATDEQEAYDLALRIEELRRPARKRNAAGSRPQRTAVLYRQHSHRTLLVRELVAHGIPFAVAGLNALETPEVRDLLACIRVVNSLSDGGSLFRVAGMPMFNIDPESMRLALKNADRDASFLSIFQKIPGSTEVLTKIENAATAARVTGMTPTSTLHIVLKEFRFEASAPPVVAFRKFVEAWCGRAIAGDGSLTQFLDYMQYFPDARNGAGIELPSVDENDRDTVRLMTVHSAKGLEFDHVFVLRANQGSFPTTFREKLFEFPQELRCELVAEGNDKTIHKEEERRLFYVAMTRVREALTLCVRPRNRDLRATGFVRELMDDADARLHWSNISAVPFTIDVAASSAAPLPGVGAWLLDPVPAESAGGILSATAVENYETCPLKFKIARFWNVPGEIVAQMQYGNAMHTLLRDYYESLRAGRPKSVDQMLALLCASLAAAGFADPVQRELYQREGTIQLSEFVRLQQMRPAADVIGTEQGFEIAIAGVRVKGRLDRVDRIAGNRVAIIDYKTGRPRNSQHADTSLQLSIYALAAREKWNYDAERLTFYNLSDNTEVATKRNHQQLDQACERVATVAAEIRAGNFDPKPGFHCAWCAYRSLCPATEERLYQLETQAAAVS